MGENEFTESYDKEFIEGFDDEGESELEAFDDDPEDNDSDNDKEAEKPEEKEEDSADDEEGEPADEGAADKIVKKEADKEADKEPEKEEADKEEAKEKEADKPKPREVVYLGEKRLIPEEEVDELIQRGLNEERMEKRNKQIEADFAMFDEFLDMAAYFDLPPKDFIKHAKDSYMELAINRIIDEGNTEAAAKELFNIRLKNARANQPKPNSIKVERDGYKELDELFRERPDLIGIKKFPDEVAALIQKGETPKYAYAKYELNKRTEEIKTLTADKKALEDKVQQLELEKKTDKAPRSAKGAGASSAKRDAFIAGFDDAGY